MVDYLTIFRSNTQTFSQWEAAFGRHHNVGWGEEAARTPSNGSWIYDQRPQTPALLRSHDLQRARFLPRLIVLLTVLNITQRSKPRLLEFSRCLPEGYAF